MFSEVSADDIVTDDSGLWWQFMFSLDEDDGDQSNPTQLQQCRLLWFAVCRPDDDRSAVQKQLIDLLRRKFARSKHRRAGKVGRPHVAWRRDTIRYATMSYCNVRSKADTSELNLQVSVSEWSARPTALWEDPGSILIADGCVYCDG